jgi:hypothetical protein
VCTESRGDIGIKRRIEFGLRGGAKTEITATIQKLQSTGKVSVDGKGKVSYVL